MLNVRHCLHMTTIHGMRRALKSMLARYACGKVKALKNALKIVC